MPQPFLHDLVAVLAAPVQAWSAPDGQVREAGAQGVFVGDVRALSQSVLRVDGEEPESIGHRLESAVVAVHVAAVRTVPAPTEDPQVLLQRRRVVRADGLRETLAVRSALPTPVEVRLEVTLASDLAPLAEVKAGVQAGRRPPAADPLGWSAPGVTVRVRADGADVEVGGDEVRLGWTLEVPADGEAEASFTVDAHTEAPVGAAAPVGLAGATAAVADALPPSEPALHDWLVRAGQDLDALLMAPTGRTGLAFAAAGAPWFLTLFGRDSLWTARLLLPLAPGLALSTLRVLAERQGTTVDPETGEQPGKILHELRAAATTAPGENDGRGLHLPPVYYGTVDATVLWVLTLADAWRAGADPEAVRALVPALRGALGWLRDHADADGDGFIEYVDESGRGLANQGWKDSGDAVRFADGRLAEGPIALAEVQGYAHAAALAGADLLERLDLVEPGEADRWRQWAGELATRFRAAFWCEDDLGPYPALALDAHGGRVDGVASNMGHLLGTGLLDAEESAAVARRLVHPTLSSGYGLRTLATTNGGYWPWRYHCGSVWTHDTAIVVDGLLRAGHVDEAAELARGLVRAAAAFDGRMPELFAGTAPEDGPPAPYPASCRPQAWASAAVVPVARALGADV